MIRTNVSPNANSAPTKRNQGRFSAGRPSRGETSVQWVNSAAEDIIHGLGDHHCRRDIGFAVKDRTSFFKNINNQTIISSRAIN